MFTINSLDYEDWTTLIRMDDSLKMNDLGVTSRPMIIKDMWYIKKRMYSNKIVTRVRQVYHRDFLQYLKYYIY
jgi:hypothetical protein